MYGKILIKSVVVQLTEEIKICSSIHRLDNFLSHFLSITKDHHGVVAIKQRVIDARVARRQRALVEHHRARLPDMENRHAVDR